MKISFYFSMVALYASSSVLIYIKKYIKCLKKNWGCLLLYFYFYIKIFEFCFYTAVIIATQIIKRTMNKRQLFHFTRKATHSCLHEFLIPLLREICKEKKIFVFECKWICFSFFCYHKTSLFSNIYAPNKHFFFHNEILTCPFYNVNNIFREVYKIWEKFSKSRTT